MPYVGNVGTSFCTEHKHQDFRYFMQVHTKIVNGILKRDIRKRYVPSYFYVDLNAGSGIVGRRKGSPVIAHEELQLNCPNYYMSLIDKDENAVVSLWRHFDLAMGARGRVDVLKKDNSEALREFSEIIKKHLN